MDDIKNSIMRQISRLEGAYSPNTIRSYYADVAQFVDWCASSSLEPFPLDADTVFRYVESMQHTHKFSTISRKLTSLNAMGNLAGHSADLHSYDLKLLLRRIRRSQATPARQAQGINVELLTRMIDAQPNSLIGIRNRALLSLGYDFLARRSELAQLERGDIEFTSCGGLRAVIRRSKADQFGRGRLVFGSTRSAHLLRAWLRRQPKDFRWVFCPVTHGRLLDRHICDRSVNEIIKLAVVKTRGERPRDRDISGHSLRVGAAQDLLRGGHDIAAIMRAGGWTNLSTVSNYLRLAEQNIWD